LSSTQFSTLNSAGINDPEGPKKYNNTEVKYVALESIEKLQHFEINFDGKNQRKIVIFGNFEMSPRCNGNRKFKTEHVVTKALVQSTFVPSIISIEAVYFIVL
jgi:hypothetical protein